MAEAPSCCMNGEWLELLSEQSQVVEDQRLSTFLLRRTRPATFLTPDLVPPPFGAHASQLQSALCLVKLNYGYSHGMYDNMQMDTISRKGFAHCLSVVWCALVLIVHCNHELLC